MGHTVGRKWPPPAPARICSYTAQHDRPSDSSRQRRNTNLDVRTLTFWQLVQFSKFNAKQNPYWNIIFYLVQGPRSKSITCAGQSSQTDTFIAGKCLIQDCLEGGQLGDNIKIINAHSLWLDKSSSIYSHMGEWGGGRQREKRGYICNTFTVKIHF